MLFIFIKKNKASVSSVLEILRIRELRKIGKFAECGKRVRGKRDLRKT